MLIDGRSRFEPTDCSSESFNRDVANALRIKLAVNIVNDPHRFHVLTVLNCFLTVGTRCG